MKTLILAASVLTSTAALASDRGPADFGAMFCASSLADDMTPIESALTPALAGIIAEAEAKNDSIQAANPDEKPPLGDGLPWRSWPDAADGCEVVAITSYSDKTLVEIQYSFSQEPAANYTDRLVLKSTQDGDESLRLDDILLLDGATLRSSLAAAFAF